MSVINILYPESGTSMYKSPRIRESFRKAAAQNRNKTIAIYVKKFYNGWYISGVSAFVENTVKTADFCGGHDRMVR